MSEPVLLVEKKDQIATLTLNRPRSMNALSAELRTAISTAFDDLMDDQSIGVVIITGAGRAFCAGLDLKELSAGNKGLDKLGEEKNDDRNLATPFEKFDRPVIGAINGAAITGGFELALACDILIASTEAGFADTHARVGILPGSALSQKLSRYIGISRAKEVSLTGNFIDADQALAWGLVNRIVGPDELLPTCRALATDILSCPQDMIRKYKRLIDEGYAMTYADSLKLERKTNREHIKSVTPESIAKRRENILERGRKQKR